MSQFKELNISEPILKALNDLGFEEPTPIQEQSVQPILEGKDIVGQAQTGTGKTAAFGIPVIQRHDSEINNVQTLIMCPTRELAIQVTEELIKIGKYIDRLQVIPVYGGQPISRQIKALKRGAHIVVGTPGRIIDHLKRGTLQLGDLKHVIFDEADEMLNMGFRDDMEQILSYADKPLQMIMFSATMSPGIKRIMSQYMNNPVTVQIARGEVTAPGIKQYVVEVRDSVRTEAISRIMDYHGYELALVFCNTKRKTDKLSRELQSRGYSSGVINGDLSQGQRDQVMNRFRNGHLDILVATDVAARGIDVEEIDVVFNYDVPQDTEYYVHRIGRTGRAGRGGIAITFSSGSKRKQVKAIERMIKQKLEPMTLPSPAEVQELRMQGLFERVTEQLEKGDLRFYIEQIEKYSDERFTTIELAAALLRMYSDQSENGTEDSASGGFDSSSDAIVRVHFNVGKKHNVYPGDLLGAITGETKVPGQAVGNIDIQPRDSYVEIPGNYVNDLISGMNNNQVKGKKVRVDVS